MDRSRNKIFIVFISCLLEFSCASFHTKKPANDGWILFMSELDVDTCNFKMNDSIVFINRKIITDRSLGVDVRSSIKLNAFKDPIHISVSFKGDIMGGELDSIKVIRAIQLDTLFESGNAKYLTIKAGIKKIEIGFSNQPIY